MAHQQLVLGQRQRGGVRPDGHAGVGERGEMLAGHVLMVEGEHVAAGREGEQVIERAVVPDLCPRGDLGGAVVGGLGQDAEADPEGDGGRGGHPGQLAGADHAHHGAHGGPTATRAGPQGPPRGTPGRIRLGWPVGGTAHAPYLT